jgi:hypothetical protein
MAEFIGVAVIGDRRTELQFERFPKIAHDRLKAALERIAHRLSAAVRAEEPTSTGKLQSETGGRVYDHGDRIIASVGVRTRDVDDHGKAGALEYGAKRPFQVRAHAATLDHLWGRAIAPITIEVGAHMRTPNIQPHRYLRGPVARLRDEHLMLLRQAVEQATAEANR